MLPDPFSLYPNFIWMNASSHGKATRRGSQTRVEGAQIRIHASAFLHSIRLRLRLRHLRSFRPRMRYLISSQSVSRWHRGDNRIIGLYSYYGNMYEKRNNRQPKTDVHLQQYFSSERKCTRYNVLPFLRMMKVRSISRCSRGRPDG
jgi:hypothetical protein